MSNPQGQIDALEAAVTLGYISLREALSAAQDFGARSSRPAPKASQDIFHIPSIYDLLGVSRRSMALSGVSSIWQCLSSRDDLYVVLSKHGYDAFSVSHVEDAGVWLHPKGNRIHRFTHTFFPWSELGSAMISPSESTGGKDAQS